MTWIDTFEPDQGQLTVVAASPVAVLAAQPALDPPALNVTEGVKTVVTHTPVAPPPVTGTVYVAETPTVPVLGPPTGPTARSTD